VPSDVLVVLDEAYVEFVTDPDFPDGVELYRDRPNVAVLRTFSKAYGLAGLRIGYAVGPQTVLDGARAAAIALSVTAQSQAAAIASLEYEEELLQRVDAIVERRDRVWQAMVAQGWPIPRPQGNFLWLPTGEASVEVATRLGEAGIVARALPPEGVRVSIGEEESVDKLLRSAEEIVRELPTGTFGPRLD
jgi:histidinol-phosphate aminotransferase